jgi:thiamine pyrophosphate-dependent acetolactate synthase large subunit-like protein
MSADCNGAPLLVAHLEAQGVEYVFGSPGARSIIIKRHTRPQSLRDTQRAQELGGSSRTPSWGG